jgi:adenylate cyclase
MMIEDTPRNEGNIEKHTSAEEETAQKAVSDSVAFNSLQTQLARLTIVVDGMQQILQSNRSAAVPDIIYEGVGKMNQVLPQWQKQLTLLEDERQGYRALSQIGQVVNSSLELDVVLQIVMDTIIRLTGAERGFLMLRDENKRLITRIARNWEQESLDVTAFDSSRTVINRVANEGKPVLTTNAQEDHRFSNQESVLAYNLRSILCVPLIVKGDVTGVIYADNRIRSGLFTQRELDLLTVFANQAAVAIENAHLFASVRRTLAEVTDLKNLMDNVFFSISSGVITADLNERVMLCNRAAEEIVGRTSKEMVGVDLGNALPSFLPIIAPYISRVLKNEQSVVDLEASPIFPDRGQVNLRLSLSPLKDVQQVTQGVAIVMEDLTKQKHLEAQRRMFGRMVSPAVIELLDADSLHLGGQRMTISVVFADIRGFTSFSETLPPEELVSVLNRYLATAADAILNEDGTIDKFLGDAVMAWFNAPILQPDHEMRAVRAAIAIRDSLEGLHRNIPARHRLSFGVGIHTGEAVLGLVGTEKRLEYTAVGDCVNTAKRIQENSGPGQILISREIYDRVSENIEALPCEPIKAKGKKLPLQVFDVLGFKKKRKG